MSAVCLHFSKMSKTKNVVNFSIGVYFITFFDLATFLLIKFFLPIFCRIFEDRLFASLISVQSSANFEFWG